MYASCTARLTAAALLIAAHAAAQAAPISFTGTFARDDERFTYEFTLPQARTIEVRSWSWGGGINGAGANVLPGGFAPVVSIFARTEPTALLALVSPGNSLSLCGPGARTDPVSGFCWDVHLGVAQPLLLPAGAYTLVLTEDDNLPQSDDLAVPFGRDGAGDFTGPMFLGAPGAFVSAGPFQRDGHWAIDIDLGAARPLPEPASGALIATGMTLAGLARRRFRRA